jgi:hypothetical protein
MIITERQINGNEPKGEMNMKQNRQKKEGTAVWRAVIRMQNSTYQRYFAHDKDTCLYMDKLAGNNPVSGVLTYSIPPCETDALHDDSDWNTFFEENAKDVAAKVGVTEFTPEREDEQEMSIYLDYVFKASADEGEIYGRIYTDILLNLISGRCVNCDQEPPNEHAQRLVDEADEEYLSRDEIPETWSECF